MFEILIGTIPVAQYALGMMPALNPMGFECYELAGGELFSTVDIKEYAPRFMDAVEGRPVTALGCYNNTIADEETLRNIERLIDNAHLFDCHVVSVFAGAAPGMSAVDSVKPFKEVFTPLCQQAQDKGVSIAIENCPAGTTMAGGGQNIGYCPDLWARMFDAVPYDNLGLEWEPCHALMQLMDPIAQLRHWVHKVKHVHGKDGTVAWDVIREHGIMGAEAYAWNRTPGFGDTNWSDVCTILMQAGYKGHIDIEGYHDPVHYDTGEYSAQKRALDYLKDCRGGRAYIEGPEYKGYQPPKVK